MARESALAAICEEARWEAADLLSRRGGAAAVDLLRGHSGELAVSPLARDRLLAMALDQAADSLASGSASLEIDLSAADIGSDGWWREVSGRRPWWRSLWARIRRG
ncbi:hypothetical protein GVN21_19815 [Caulobacter sp. SLTY]|uniref:hypothetical protein n=1 Tax=Caulobacter sp. SLTY TaxID=2683262 RepID=UPI0014132CEA|nr:hypothetical protein [Caulobacter sp. SLTY]NBB17614.1 hypothetical protein [Caulobacter sp. SLTY]